MNGIAVDAIVGFFTFGSIRYMLPNYVLGKTIDMWVCFVLSFCYAICIYVNKHAREIYTYVSSSSL